MEESTFNSGVRSRLCASLLEAGPDDGGCGLNLSDMMFRHGQFTQVVNEESGELEAVPGCFDTQLTTHFPLHCAEELAELRADWGSIWLAFGFNRGWPIGAEQPIDLVSQRSSLPSAVLSSLFSSLLTRSSQVRDYFGEKIALYFAWLELYSKFLFILGILGCITFAFQVAPESYGGYEGDIDANPFGTVYAIFVALWAVTFTEFWKRRQAELHFQWGLEASATSEPIRPECRRTKVRNVMTGRVVEVSGRRLFLRRTLCPSGLA